MIISNIIGGLGNQMFQYAVGRALSLKNSLPLKIDISGFKNYTWHLFELEKAFEAKFQTSTKRDIIKILGWQGTDFGQKVIFSKPFGWLKRKEYVVEPHFNYWSGLEKITGKAYLKGFWQSEKYFEKYSEQIRKDFTFREFKTKQNLELAQKIRSTNSISIHIRRGNYVTNSTVANFHGTCDSAYYEKSVNFLADKISDPHFFVFSDDPDWVKEKLKLNYPFTHISHNKGSEGFYDMALMSLSKCNIIANSTFSWWAGWLNENKNKIVIAPEKWFENENQQKMSRDLCPESWLRF